MKLHKPRVMLFAYDGTGLGHLMRLVRIAGCMKDDFNPLIVTGHRAVCLVIPDNIEFIRLPVFNRHAEQQLDLKGHSLSIKAFRSDSISYIVKLFKPDVFITDYLPAGKKGELLQVITNSNCLKYLVMRGDIGSMDQLNDVVFTTENNALIQQFYERVFIASDPRFKDFSSEPSIPDCVRNKFQHVGYVCNQISMGDVEAMRSARGLTGKDKWVVCSAGGGRMGEELIRTCLEIARSGRFDGVKFDIVRGYYSDLPWQNNAYVNQSLCSDIIYSRSTDLLPLMHASADCVICSGGYNSLLETIQGREKHVLAYSVQVGENEQVRNILNFRQFYPIHHIQRLDSLPDDLARSIEAPPQKTTMPHLDTNGAQQIVKAIKEDLLHAERL